MVLSKYQYRFEMRLIFVWQDEIADKVSGDRADKANGGGSWVGMQDRINISEYWAMTDTAAQWYGLPDYEETFLRVNGGYMTEDDYEHDAALTHFQVTSDDEYFMNEYNAMFPVKRVRFSLDATSVSN